LDKQGAVVISGSSRGIGKYLAEYFIGLGYYVYGCSRSGKSIVHENYFHELLDVSDENKVIDWLRKIKRTGNRIEILICNAGEIQATALLVGTTSEQYDGIFKTNVSGTFFLCRETTKIMLQQKYGRIITFSSIAARTHDAGASLYAASKKAVEEMSCILAKEVSAFGIMVNCIAPGYTETETVAQLGDDFRDVVLSKHFAKRPLTFEQIAHTVDFLTSEKNDFISGQVINLGFI